MTFWGPYNILGSGNLIKQSDKISNYRNRISRYLDFWGLKSPRMVSKTTNSKRVNHIYFSTGGDFVGTVQFLQSWLYDLVFTILAYTSYGLLEIPCDIVFWDAVI